MSSAAALPPRALRHLPRFGTGSGPEGLLRMEALTAPFEPWLRRQRAIKITGSNGKTSLAVLTESVLRSLGVPTGLYTSPHLHRFEERIRTDGKEIAVADFEASADRVRARWSRCRAELPPRAGEAMALFEGLTVAALDHWSRTPEADATRALVLEAGMGGRFDSTRIVPGEVAALTTIELEHEAVLGESEAEILRDKARLCPEGGVLVHGPMRTDLEGLLSERARARGIQLAPMAARARWKTRGFRDHADGCLRRIADLEVTLDPGTGAASPLSLELCQVELALLGARQVENAAMAVILAWEWCRRHRPELVDPSDARRWGRWFHRGLESARCPGRLERVARDPDVFVDVGHTPAAVAGALRGLREICPGPAPMVVLGVSPEKKIEAIAAEARPTSGVVATRATVHGAPVEEVADALEASGADLRVIREEDPAKAVAAAREGARQRGAPVLIAGSLYLAAEMRELMLGHAP